MGRYRKNDQRSQCKAEGKKQVVNKIKLIQILRNLKELVVCEINFMPAWHLKWKTNTVYLAL